MQSVELVPDFSTNSTVERRYSQEQKSCRFEHPLKLAGLVDCSSYWKSVSSVHHERTNVDSDYLTRRSHIDECVLVVLSDGNMFYKYSVHVLLV